VVHDMLGITDRYLPKFAKKYAEMQQEMVAAVGTYVQEVRDGAFPTPAHGFKMAEDVLDKLREEIRGR
jgi:3-methyl-2-oxobutanoate hydroxymethyltransferase